MRQVFLCAVVFLFLLPSPLLRLAPPSGRPCILDASVTPEKVQCGTIMVITAMVRDAEGIAKVQAVNHHEKGSDVMDLSLVSGTRYEGVWCGSWVVHDTAQKEYVSVITAYSSAGSLASMTVTWSDPSWWNISWKYRKTAAILNPSADYQMKLTIGYDNSASGVDVQLEGKCNPDFSDVRFANTNNTAEFNYWIENKTNGDKAQFWVKTDGDDSLNIYYGNAAAGSNSNGTRTFPLFDDFLGTSLKSQWLASANSYSVSGGVLRINIGGIGLQNALSFNMNDGYILEGRILYHTNSGGYSGALSAQSSMYTQGSNAGADATNLYMRDTGSRNVHRWTGIGATANYDCGNSDVFTSSDSVWYILGARFDATGVSLSKDRTTQWSYSCGWAKNIRYVSLGAFTGSASYDIQDTSYDWVLIRKYASPAPAWGAFGGQEIALPTKPVLEQPEDTAATLDTTPTFIWDASENARNHTIQISDQSDFSALEINASLGASAQTYTPAAPLHEGTWYWRVIANNSQGMNSSAPWRFIVDTSAPDPPGLTSPADGSAVSDDHVTFSWNSTTDAISGVRCYQLQISADNFSSYLVNQNTTDNTTLSLTGSVAGRLHWRVRAWDHAGNPSVFSETRSLTVFDFTVTATSSAVTILRGGTGSTSLQIHVAYGDDETVTLTGAWTGIIPTGITTNFSTSSAAGSFTSVLNFQTSADATTGEFTLNVTAASLTGSKTVVITVRIAGMLFQLSASPTSFSLTRSDRDASMISVTFQYGSKESVSLSGEWVGSSPTGVTVSFSSLSGLPPFDSTLSLSTSNQASPGKYTYKVTASGGGITTWIYLSVEIKTNLTLIFHPDKTTYEKGQEIRVSGSVKDPNGNAVEHGTVTLMFSTGHWNEQKNATIADGLFTANYFITFDKFEGNWTISATAVDTLGHTTAAPVDIIVSVTTPQIYQYYSITVLSPLPGQVYKRGDVVSFTVSLLENETKVRGASVTIQPPEGASVQLIEISPGLYSTSYTLNIDAPLGNWTVYVMGSTGEDAFFKAGFTYIPIKIEPTGLSLELTEPVETSFETGQKMTFTAKLYYPDSVPVEEGIVSAIVNNKETLSFKKSGDGVYTASYTPSDRDIGYMTLQIITSDVYGNLGSTQVKTYEIIPLQFSSYFSRYWWITSVILLGLMVALWYVTRDVTRIVRLRNFKWETMELNRLKKDKASEYFLQGSISRDTYDNLIQEYESKLAKIEKDRHILEKKIQRKDKGHRTGYPWRGMK